MSLPVIVSILKISLSLRYSLLIDRCFVELDIVPQICPDCGGVLR